MGGWRKREGGGVEIEGKEKSAVDELEEGSE